MKACGRMIKGVDKADLSVQIPVVRMKERGRMVLNTVEEYSISPMETALRGTGSMVNSMGLYTSDLIPPLRGMTLSTDSYCYMHVTYLGYKI